MCGIFGILGEYDEERAKELSKRMVHRGHDQSGCYKNEYGIICHERLSIVDVKHGKQPIQGTESSYVVHNGEIYNHETLRETEFKHVPYRTHSDSEVIVHLYEKYGVDFCNMLDGVFTFIIMDGSKIMVARDPIGVKPLYFGRDSRNNIYFASEMKSIASECDQEMIPFPPGHYFTVETGFVQYFKPSWYNWETCKKDCILAKLKNSLEEATIKRIATEVPMGVLLSGGLDSSLLSAIVAKKLKKEGFPYGKLHSFSVGLDPSAPDLVAARKVAKFIGTEHHEVHFTVEEGLVEIEKLVWHLESYDVTSIRSSVPMYLLSKYVHQQKIKVILSGEGSDEVLGGYLYFNNAPNDEEFQKETISRVCRLSTADCLRADKATMAFSLETRVPFLDKQFLIDAMSIDPRCKRHNYNSEKPIEKYIIRQAFDEEQCGEAYLPEDVLWRQKEQFSDGVGYNWIDTIMKYCASKVSDVEFAAAKDIYKINPPDTKEALYIRNIFHKLFPNPLCDRTVSPWVPKWQMSKDPSGRFCDKHVSSKALDTNSTICT